MRPPRCYALRTASQHATANALNFAANFNSGNSVRFLLGIISCEGRAPRCAILLDPAQPATFASFTSASSNRRLCLRWKSAICRICITKATSGAFAVILRVRAGLYAAIWQACNTCSGSQSKSDALYGLELTLGSQVGTQTSNSASSRLTLQSVSIW